MMRKTEITNCKTISDFLSPLPEAEKLNDKTKLQQMYSGLQFLCVWRLGGSIRAADGTNTQELNKEGPEVKCDEQGGNPSRRDTETSEFEFRDRRNIPNEAAQGHVTCCRHK